MSRYVVMVVAFGCAATARAPSTSSAPEIRSATLVWEIGVNEPGGPSAMVETVLPAMYRGTPVWRIVHRDLDPTADGTHNSYDMYDVDRATLEPLRSIMDREGFRLSIAFERGRATIDKEDGEGRVHGEVQVEHPRPEGPGQTVLLASLPLRPGYATSFPIVDRWAKDDPNRVVQIDLSVAGAQAIETRLGRSEVLEVVLTPRNGAFKIRQWVLSQPPHYPVKTEYRRGDLLLISEVTRMLL